MKYYLVTGGSSGIGKVIACRLAQNNKVIILGRNRERLEALSGENENIISLCCDFLCLDQISGIFDFCKEKGIKLDGLVHCAGITKTIPVSANDINDMREVMTVNCMSFEELMKYFSKKRFSNDGASVVAISSMSARTYTNGMSIYAASKAALNTMVKVAAKELARRKIRINAIMPGFVNTEMLALPRENINNFDEKVLHDQPWGLIEPEQVADLVEFLLSFKAQMITGALIPITGGRII